MRLLFLLLTIAVGSCSTYSEKELDEFDKKIQEWIKQQDIQFNKTESGLYYSFERIGKGRKIKYTDSIKVMFKGSLLDGTIFDIEEKPISFAVREVIIAWKEILLMSKNKAKIQIILPPQLGYGNHKLDKIPQNTILFYEIEIVDIK
jgi:FKBP-type peptidyl-prolyl cis-trans isomerase FkpA